MLRTCRMDRIESKIAKLRRECHPKTKFKPLFEHLLNLARDSAKHGYCTRAGQELRHAKKVARY
jgi:hypothetical protein